ncbi:MAG: competence/damage-inducible protein A [Bacillota bacterium]|nr:competence/damage-inducible protein A [Bacillota bacterium]
MKSAILSVGTELLFGQIVNTNAVYLSQQLNLLGIDVMYHYTVGDNPRRLSELLDHIYQDCDLIIATGGLGPTQDDLTKETVAEAFDDRLVLHQPSMDALEKRFAGRKIPMTENNRKQAWLPSKAEVLPNQCGTAPGFALEKDGRIIICLPGPPKEMKDMFQKAVKPYLEARSESVIYYKMLRAFGIGESALETALLDLIDGQTDPTIATYAKEGECSVRVASKRATREEAKAAVEEMTEKVKERVGKYIYSCDNEELCQVVARKLMEKGVSVASAESCTGGLFAGALTDIPGISAVFDRGLVTYSNRAKVEELGVRPETLERFGAVSRETAGEMAEGLARISGCQVCVAVTGVAGPDGGTPEKPVGLAYVAVHYKGKTQCRETTFRNQDRTWNRRHCVLLMLDTINKVLEEE